MLKITIFEGRTKIQPCTIIDVKNVMDLKYLIKGLSILYSPFLVCCSKNVSSFDIDRKLLGCLLMGFHFIHNKTKSLAT